MRLRYALISLFLALTAVPLTVFWAWPHSQVMQSELDEVRGRHLLIARNLGAALQRYHQDVLAAFNMITVNLVEQRKIDQAQDFLLNLSFRHVCIADEATGVVTVEVSPFALPCPEVVPKERMNLFTGLAREDRTVFSEVLEGPDGDPVIYLVRRVKRQLAIGALHTDYFVRLADAISFGVRGHAAIVDHKGNILAHPHDDWTAGRRNVAEITAVARMLNGEIGIDTFFSPALESEMIAGFAVVPEVGWGVMIPQPVAELQEEARQAVKSALTVLLFGILIACVCAWIVSILFARPLELISLAAEKVVQGGEPGEIAALESKLVPVEFHRVQSSFNAMIRRLRDNLVRINKLAYQDKVTGLPNRALFRRYVTEKLAELQVAGRGGLLLFIDLDGFKTINDRLGHDLGDELLRFFSVRLQALFDRRGPSSDDIDETEPRHAQHASGHLVARIGGDEFAAFLSGVDPDYDSQRIARAVLRCVRDPFQVGGQEATIGVSIGLARAPADADSYTMLVRRADMAMYEAKRSGKNTYRFYDRSIETALIQADRLRREIPRALQLDQFELYFQPRFDIASHQVHCMEALIRWHHPNDGLLLPDEFLPTVESSETMIAIDYWVLQKALQQLSCWSDDHPDLTISVNMSARQLTHLALADDVIQLVRQANVDPARIELEVTEHAILSNEDTARQVIERLHQCGLRIAIDDFGQGYSNFARFVELPVDVIKLDRGLVSKLTDDPRVPRIVRSLITMAEGLDCAIVAEGIEALEQVSILSKIGCTEFQGYLFSRPLPVREIESWLSRVSATVEAMKQDRVTLLRPV